MQNKFIVTPFFLDQYQPWHEQPAGLKELTGPNPVLNIPTLPQGELQQRMSTIHRAIADFVVDALANGYRPVSIAWDCCSAIGFAAGLQHAGIEPVLVWLDAHGDFNTWETTPSGFIGGMPLAMIAGRGEQTLPEAVNLHPVPESEIILCDGRALDPAEKQALDSSSVSQVKDIKLLLDQLPAARPVYIHLDVDITHLDDAPAMSYPAPGGPPAADLKDIFHSLAKTRQIAGVSVATWNPAIDTDGRTQSVCVNLIKALIDE